LSIIFNKKSLVKNPVKGGTPAIENSVKEASRSALALKLSPEKEFKVLLKEAKLLINIQKSSDRLTL
jgi:hypothetical protein